MPDQTPETTELMVDALRVAYTRIFNTRMDHLRSAEATDRLNQEALDAIDAALEAATGSRYGKRPCSLSEYRAKTALQRAAPDLLTACEMIFDAFAKGEAVFVHKRQSTSDPYHPANVALCTAIASAKGETHDQPDQTSVHHC